MPKPRVGAGGGFAAIAYVLKKGREAGGLWKLYKRLRTRNACKTCAFGMGGQRGGMVNEAGRFPEVCKKSVQAQAGDMADGIPLSFFLNTPIAAMEKMTSAELERLGRITVPLIAESGDTHFRKTSWDEAIERTAAAFRESPAEDVFVYASGRSSNEAAYLLQLVARAYGTPNINNCSSYCHSASGVGLSKVYGSGTASVVLDDLAKADFALVAGANPASNHPRLIGQLVKLRRRGGKVIVVNPLRELGLVRFRIPSDMRSLFFGSTVSDLYLQPHVGGDVALFKALLKGVVEKNGVDADYVASHTTGWDAVRQDIDGSSWDDLVAASGVPGEQIAEAVRMLLDAKRGIFMWAMGLTQHVHGVDNILALANLALARGWLGGEGTGLLPIRGHSNVQGVGSVGVTPRLKAAFAQKITELYGIQVPEGPGLDTYDAMEASSEGRIQAALLLGGNLYAANPDSRWAADAMQKIGLTTYISTKLNEGHIHGRGRTCLILPCLARDEEPQATSQESMFNFVRLSEGGDPAVPGEMRSEVEIIASLAEKLLPPDRFGWAELRSHAKLREAIGHTVPGYGASSRLDGDGGEFQIEGRTFHEPRFGTTDGKAHFHVTPAPAAMANGGEFRLMTLRSEGQFNTVVYDEEDLYRGNSRRDVVMMSAADAERLGVGDGDRIVVSNETGSMEASVAIADIREGNLAMYYPEANVLVPRNIDRRSGTPAFKSMTARVEPVAPAVETV